jgi:hypothetical protein
MAERIRGELQQARFGTSSWDRELFASVLEAEVSSEQYRRKYNEYRPHSGLDYLTPAGFSARCRKQTAIVPEPGVCTNIDPGTKIVDPPQPHGRPSASAASISK